MMTVERVKQLGRQVRVRWAQILGVWLGVYLVLVTWQAVEDEYWAHQPRERFFSYLSIEPIGFDPKSVLFESTSVWRVQPDLVTWNDRLRCHDPADDDRDWPIWSTQITQSTAERLTDGLARSVSWSYTSSVPDDGRECFVRSTITVEARGAVVMQTIESPEFVPRAG